MPSTCIVDILAHRGWDYKPHRACRALVGASQHEVRVYGEDRWHVSQSGVAVPETSSASKRLPRTNSTDKEVGTSLRVSPCLLRKRRIPATGPVLGVIRASSGQSLDKQ